MIISKIKIGDVFNRNNGTAKILEIKNARTIKILTDNGTELWCALNNLTKGEVKDPLDKTFFGKGYKGFGKYNSNSKCYAKWKSMLSRCYSQNNCFSSLCKEWHNLQNFGKWFDNHYIKGYHLDKDLKIYKNREYGPDKCTFLPPKINCMFQEKIKKNNLPYGGNKKL